VSRRRIGSKEPYARVYASAKDHPRYMRAGLEANGLMLRALAYCADHLTDGLVPESWLVAQGGRRPVKALLDAGLLTRGPDGYRIRDFLDANQSREEVQGRRAKWNAKKAQAKQDSPPDSPGEQAGEQVGESNGDSSGGGTTQILNLSSPHKPPEGASANGHDDQVPVVRSRGAVEASPPPSPAAPPSPPPVRYQGKPVPAARVRLAEDALRVFNEQAKPPKPFRAYDGARKPTASLRLILGALTGWPDELPDVEACERLIRATLRSPWWDGPPTPNVIFGPKAIEKNFQLAVGPARQGSPVDRWLTAVMPDDLGDAA
jgi:hypothetical protein